MIDKIIRKHTAFILKGRIRPPGLEFVIVMKREQVHLSGAQFGVVVFELVPDGLEDGGEGSDADAGADQHADLVVEDVLAGRPKRAVHAHPEDGQQVG